MPAVHERRRERLADVLTSVGLGSALITTLLNVRYLTGFTGSAGTLLVTASGSAWIATDSRYELQVAKGMPGCSGASHPVGTARVGSERPRIRAPRGGV